MRLFGRAVWLERVEVLSMYLRMVSWLSPLEWREENGGVERAWLFNDSGDHEQLRRLRVRLQLERGI